MDLLFKVNTDETLGRHLVAARDIQPGEIIIKESPLIWGPFLHTVPVCLACGKVLTEKNSTPCSKCGWPVCNPECEASPLHAPECHFTASRDSKININNFGIIHPNYQFVTPLRCLYLKQFCEEKWQKLMSLQSEGASNNFPSDFMKKFFKFDFTTEEIEKVCGILTVNGHEVPLSNPPFLAIYETSSFLEHNCLANCSKTFTDDGELLILAAASIKNGEHLSICYTDPLWGTVNRRGYLYQTKQFWCKCSRCKDPSERGTHINSLICPKCDGYLLPATFLEDNETWRCTKCDQELPEENAVELLNRIGLHLSEMTKGSPETCKDFLKRFRNLLHPHHYYMLDVKMALIQMLASDNLQSLVDDDLKLLLELAGELREIVGRVAVAERRLGGLLQFQYVKGLLEVSQREDRVEEEQLLKCKKGFEECEELLKNEASRSQEGMILRQVRFHLRGIDALLEEVNKS